MQLLVLGGTAFLGSEVARQAVARGWSVTCAARGRSGSFPDGVRAVTLDRDAEDGLQQLAGQPWDAVVDLARRPGQVRRAVRDLSARHWVFVSTVNVYADQASRNQDESAALLPLPPETTTEPSEYGPAKVACELIIRGTGSWTIARAGLIAGPGDGSGRLGYWPWRFARDRTAPVLVPADDDQPVQVIDVRDLAGWLLDCAAARTAGVFNACGTPTNLGEVLAAARRVAGHTGPVLSASPDWLAEHRVEAWMGERSLPLWVGGDSGLWGFEDFCNHRVLDAGLALRPLADTLRDTLDWETGERAEQREAGIEDADHDELIEDLAAGADR